MFGGYYTYFQLQITVDWKGENQCYFGERCHLHLHLSLACLVAHTAYVRNQKKVVFMVNRMEFYEDVNETRCRNSSLNFSTAVLSSWSSS